MRDDARMDRCNYGSAATAFVALRNDCAGLSKKVGSRGNDGLRLPSVVAFVAQRFPGVRAGPKRDDLALPALQGPQLAERTASDGR